MLEVESSRIVHASMNYLRKHDLQITIEFKKTKNKQIKTCGVPGWGAGIDNYIKIKIYNCIKIIINLKRMNLCF